jgi:pSer/pThr/pTyr-binding forkhead associated (FHA) protein
MAPEQPLHRYSLELRNAGATRSLTVRAGDVLAIGRSSSNNLVVKQELVSRRHARLHVLNGELRIVDLNSSHGTFVNGRRLPSGGEQLLEPSAEIGIGPEVILCLQPEQSRSTKSLAPPKALSRIPASTYWGVLASTGVVSAMLWLALWLPWDEEPQEQVAIPVVQAKVASTLIPTFTPATKIGTVLQQPTTESTQAPLPTIAQPIPTPIPVWTPSPAPPVVALADGAANQPNLDAASVAAAPAVQPAAKVPETDWDPRLDALGVRVERANTSGSYWRLVRGLWEDEKQAGGTHNIYVDVLDEAGQRVLGQPVRITWSEGSYVGTTGDKPPSEYPFNYPMYAAGNAYAVQLEGLPSDVVQGAGMGSIEARGMGVHTSFRFVFQRTTP